MKRSSYGLNIVGVALLLFGGLSASAEEADHHPTSLRIDPLMARDVRLTTAVVETRPSGDGVTALGELSVNEDAYVEVGSPISARAVRLRVGMGDHVNAGDPLLDLESPEIGRARAALPQAEARLRLAERVRDRKRGLVSERVASQRELQEAEAAAAEAAADLSAARAGLTALGIDPLAKAELSDIARLTLTTPIAGRVLERSVVAGQMVSPDRWLFRIADLSRLWLTARVYERDAMRISVPAKARISFPALPGRTFAGDILLIGLQVDPDSRTFPVRIAIENRDEQLRPGMSATAWLPFGDSGTPLVSVPTMALQQTPGGWTVFVPKEENVFEVRVVGRGRDLGGETEILGGVAAGETVVVDGAFLLKAELDKARGAGGQHAH